MGRSGRSGGGSFGGGSFRSGGFSSGRSSGGFSGGFGGSRSGRSGGSSFGGFSSGRSSSGSFGGYRAPRMFGGFMGPVIINNSPRTYGGGGGQGGQNGPDNRGGGKGCGCSALLFVCVILLILGVFIFVLSPGETGGDIAKSTVEREPLPEGSVRLTDYYSDEEGWITNPSRLTQGMKKFYKMTGVQPYLYIASQVDGTTEPTVAQLSAFSDGLYDTLFDDEAHFLLVFCDTGYGGFRCGYTAGRLAKSVMDDEAISVLNDYLDRYYSSDMSDEEFFSESFGKTAERIMTVTKSPWPTVAVAVSAVIVVLLLFMWWSKAKEKKRQEDIRTQQILNTPLEKFGDSELDDLAKKYEGTPSPAASARPAEPVRSAPAGPGSAPPPGGPPTGGYSAQADRALDSARSGPSSDNRDIHELVSQWFDAQDGPSDGGGR